MPRRTCPSCLSQVSIQITKCPYCGATVPAEAVTGPSPAIPPASRPSAGGPQARAAVGSATPDRAVDIKAVLLGLGVIVIGTVVGGVVIGLLYSPVIPIDGSAPDSSGLGPYIASLVLGLGLTIYGAYLAARRAGFRELVHAGIVGMVAMLVGLGMLLTAQSTGPGWFVATSAILTLPSALLGGKLARRDR